MCDKYMVIGFINIPSPLWFFVFKGGACWFSREGAVYRYNSVMSLEDGASPYNSVIPHDF